MEVMAGAREDRVVFMATLQRCAWSLEKFVVEMRLLGMLAGGKLGVVAAVQDAKRELKGLGRMLECG